MGSDSMGNATRRPRPGGPRVFATRELPGGALAALAGEGIALQVWPGERPPSPGELKGELRGADALVCLLSDRIDAALLAACPQLRVVSSCSVGVDHVDLAEASRRGIPVGHTPGVLTETTADLTLALLLAAARRIPEADRFVRGGGWDPELGWQPDLLLGRDLHGATLGILGLGPIGQAVARRAAGFGMRVLGWTRSRRSVPGVDPASLDEVLESADFLSLHVALTPETRHLIGPAELRRMKPGAILVNTARGGLVDEPALLAALLEGPLGGAALDVFEQEPLPTTSPLLALPNLVVAPHIGSASLATRARMAELCVANLLAGLRGEPMPHCANPEAQAAAEAGG